MKYERISNEVGKIRWPVLIVALIVIFLCIFSNWFYVSLHFFLNMKFDKERQSNHSVYQWNLRTLTLLDSLLIRFQRQNGGNQFNFIVNVNWKQIYSWYRIRMLTYRINFCISYPMFRTNWVFYICTRANKKEQLIISNFFSKYVREAHMVRLIWGIRISFSFEWYYLRSFDWENRIDCLIFVYNRE